MATRATPGAAAELTDARGASQDVAGGRAPAGPNCATGTRVEVAADLGLDPEQSVRLRNHWPPPPARAAGLIRVIAGSTMNAATPRTLARRLAPCRWRWRLQG